MEIILKEDVINLGYKGDIVKVKDGYGRNYLIPTKKAVIASESAKKMLAEDNRQRAHKFEQIKNNAVELSEKIAALGSGGFHPRESRAAPRRGPRPRLAGRCHQ